MSRPFAPRNSSSTPFTRINGKIRAREVRVIADDGEQMGVMPLNDALNLARQRGVDLVEVAAQANPPVCKLIDFGKYRYEQAKKEKESRKHHHANKVKEIQLSATIDPHDFSVKLQHAIEFLCDEMKVKVALRFRGREMAHTEFGYQQVNNFIKELAPWGHPDSTPKLMGRSINVMLSPLPRNKRAKPPEEAEDSAGEVKPEPKPAKAAASEGKKIVPTNAAEQPAASGFANNPFSRLNS